MSNRPTLTPSDGSPWNSSERWDRQPIYRVVEVVRDATGRLRREGRVWHTSLDITRKFGRALAANSTAHKVQIADNAGDVHEELSVASVEQRQSRWEGWQDIALPACPPKIRRRRRNTPSPSTFTPLDNPFAQMEVLDELKIALAAAGEVAADHVTVGDPGKAHAVVNTAAAQVAPHLPPDHPAFHVDAGTT